MPIVPESVSLSIQRSVKIEEYKYNKIELGMTIKTHDENPKEVIKRLYNYLNPQVDTLLKAELDKAKHAKQVIADVMEDNDIPF